MHPNEQLLHILLLKKNPAEHLLQVALVQVEQFEGQQNPAVRVYPVWQVLHVPLVQLLQLFGQQKPRVS